MSQRIPDTNKIHDLFTNNLPFFARNALVIKPKNGPEELFVFNKAQEYLHSRVEQQLLLKGRVRIIIVKGRQQGCSTYIAGRFYHKATRVNGQSVFILSHEGETTKKLFRMVERFHDNCPTPLKPHADVASKKEYRFAEIGSDYTVGTAGNDKVGRGGTLQLFHGSEVAFWEKTEGIETGVLQSVSDMDGTEIFLESTANGMDGFFYDKVMDAIDGKGDYELVFIPWFWQDEYTRTPEEDFVLTEEEEQIRKTYNLTLGQMCWRRAKIVELKAEWKFMQEYPCTVLEAFQSSAESFINNQAVAKARKSKVRDTESPLIIGLDPGRTRDRTVFVWRRGRQIIKYKIYKFEKGKDEMIQMQIAGLAMQIIKSDDPDKMFVDVGEGWGVVDRLVENGYGDVVQGIGFGMGASDEKTYLNKRAEMACLFRDWIQGEDGEVSIPDDDKLHKDIVAVPKEKSNSSGLIVLPSKDEIRKKYKRSTDVFDGSILTFAFPVKRAHNAASMVKKVTRSQTSSLSTLRRLRSNRR